jgi:hypothetical protein
MIEIFVLPAFPLSTPPGPIHMFSYHYVALSITKISQVARVKTFKPYSYPILGNGGDNWFLFR